ncbi:hypothetical protein HID58_064110 [Brassica napus]|uniref:Uncharacterized protein n=1 Tax=Brassica napus TaxID=3708 RepID=A0ABQ7Z916_BRANA|nr:hypothetical protein HID58_064110 [Brassica napus]
MDFSSNAGMMMENKRNVVCSLEESNIKRHKSDLSSKVLSAPYLQTVSTATLVEMEQYSLSNRGLCLAPMEFTAGVAQSNGADIWASVKTPPSPALNVKSQSPFR